MPQVPLVGHRKLQNRLYSLRKNCRSNDVLEWRAKCLEGVPNSLFLHLNKTAKTCFVESVSQGLSTLQEYFKIYFIISTLELKNVIKWIYFVLNHWSTRSGPLGPLGEAGLAHLSHPPPYGHVTAKKSTYYNFIIEPNFSYPQVCLKTHRVLDLHWKLSVIKVEKTLHETGSVLILI